MVLLNLLGMFDLLRCPFEVVSQVGAWKCCFAVVLLLAQQVPEDGVAVVACSASWQLVCGVLHGSFPWCLIST